MRRIQLSEDIQPLSEVRSRVTFYIDKVKKTKRPLLITQNGKSAAVLLDVDEYETMIEKIELLEDIKTAEEQIAGKMGISHSEVKRKLTNRK